MSRSLTCESAGLMVARMAKFSYMTGGSRRECGLRRSEPTVHIL